MAARRRYAARRESGLRGLKPDRRTQTRAQSSQRRRGRLRSRRGRPSASSTPPAAGRSSRALGRHGAPQLGVGRSSAAVGTLARTSSRKGRKLRRRLARKTGAEYAVKPPRVGLEQFRRRSHSRHPRRVIERDCLGRDNHRRLGPRVLPRGHQQPGGITLAVHVPRPQTCVLKAVNGVADSAQLLPINGQPWGGEVGHRCSNMPSASPARRAPPVQVRTTRATPRAEVPSRPARGRGRGLRWPATMTRLDARHHAPRCRLRCDPEALRRSP